MSKSGTHKEVKYIIYRVPTLSDFFHIYKLKGTEEKGGGQRYIDVPGIEDEAWKKFFGGVRGVKHEITRKSGSLWHFKIKSIGLPGTQDLEIGRRREKNCNIRRQNINSRDANRVLAWHPKYGFPKPKNPAKRSNPPKGLCIYIVRTKDNEYWAGWFRLNSPCKTVECENVLAPMLSRKRRTGFLDMSRTKLYLDSTNWLTPFSVKVIRKHPSNATGYAKVSAKKIISEMQIKKQYSWRAEEKILNDLFDEDENDKRKTKKQQETIRKIRNRNQKAAKIIKELYNGKCQFTGKIAFLKRNGIPYAEIHHMIPLGEGGGDSPYNLVVVNPLIHRMLHYADVSGIDFGKIKSDKLRIRINKKSYTITWHPEHTRLIKEVEKIRNKI